MASGEGEVYTWYDGVNLAGKGGIWGGVEMKNVVFVEGKGKQ